MMEQLKPPMTSLVSFTEDLGLDDGTIETTNDVSVSFTEDLGLDDGTVESTNEIAVVSSSQKILD